MMSFSIILISHGGFSEGILESGAMLFGQQENNSAIVFDPTDSPEKLEEKIAQQLSLEPSEQQILFLVDLYGGTPFNCANQIVEQHPEKMAIAAGMNLPMLIQAMTDQMLGEKDLPTVVQHLLAEGKKNIKTPHEVEASSSQTNRLMVEEENNLKDLGILHVRLDERMIHGQVATLWLGSTGATRAMIIDDEVVKDDLAKSSLKTAVPGGVKLSILKTETAIKRLKDKAYQGQKVFIIVKKIATIFDLIDAGIPITAFNLGNSSQQKGELPVTRSVFLSKEEIDQLYALEKQGIQITAQMVPMEEAKPFSKFYGK
jgi:PTS system mannose-specific IIB component